MYGPASTGVSAIPEGQYWVVYDGDEDGSDYHEEMLVKVAVSEVVKRRSDLGVTNRGHSLVGRDYIVGQKSIRSRCGVLGNTYATMPRLWKNAKKAGSCWTQLPASSITKKKGTEGVRYV